MAVWFTRQDRFLRRCPRGHALNSIGPRVSSTNSRSINLQETSTELDSAMVRPREPFVLEDSPNGRTLVVTGPWTEEAARLLSSGEADGLTLSYEKGFSENDLAFFEEWPLRRLRIHDPLLVDLTPVSRFSRSLEELSVRAASEARLDFAGFPRLRNISCEWQLLRSPRVEVRSLETLSTWNFDEADFRPLSNHPKLKRLTIRDAPRLRTLRGISALQSISVLGIHLARELSDISELSDADPTLGELSFDFCSRIERINALSALEHLRHLGVNDCKRIESLAPIIGLKELEVLDAWGSTRIVDGNLSLLLSLPQLRELRMKSRIDYRPSVDEIRTAIRRK